MNTKKNSFTKLLSFAIISVLLICIMVFAISGWQEEPKDENSANNGETSEEGDNNIPPPTPPTNTEKEEETPKYINAMTGLFVSENEFNSSPLGILINAQSTVYGLSTADVCIEFPTELSSNRLLFFTSKPDSLWKIGPIAQTREYINAVASLFMLPILHFSSDDIIEYGETDLGNLSLDLSSYSDTYFKELQYTYTTGPLVNLMFERMTLTKDFSYGKIPFLFSEDTFLGTLEAKTVMIPYSSTNESEFYYSEEKGTYSYHKSGNAVTDILYGKGVEFKNLFILLSDATTHETAGGSELVVDTLSGGRGYYISEGKKTEILWSVDENSNYKFQTLDGNLLSVNKGNSYITFYKSFLSENIVTK